MLNKTVLTAALAAAFVAPYASAADDKDLAALREQVRQMKESYEARLQSLEQRLQETQSALAQAQNAAAPAPAPAPGPAAAAASGAAPAAAAAPAPVDVAAATEAAPVAPAAPAASNAFNPNISLVLAGNYTNLSRDPNQYRIQGFATPAGEVGPGARGFNLGESELTMAANIDPMFSGQLTFSLGSDDTVGVEEAFFQTRALDNGLNFKAGRFLSSIGYLNSQHAHAWDFADAPLAYQAFFGGQYKPDGVQLRWLAPTDTFIELGAEVGSGRSFPGNDRNKNGVGATSLFAHAGDDIGESGSWRAGLSYLRTGSAERSFDDNGLPNAFTGRASVVMADGIYKWAPHGDPTRQNLKVQGEYLRRHEDGTLAGAAGAAGGFDSTQSGWYLQTVYQFMPYWRAGVRYDHLSSGTPRIGLVQDGTLGMDAFAFLSPYSPSRSTVMVDYSPSEFSRLRLQFAHDEARPGGADNQIFLQYIMSLGTHAAHAF